MAFRRQLIHPNRSKEKRISTKANHVLCTCEWCEYAGQTKHVGSELNVLCIRLLIASAFSFSPCTTQCESIRCHCSSMVVESAFDCLPRSNNQDISFSRVCVSVLSYQSLFLLRCVCNPFFSKQQRQRRNPIQTNEWNESNRSSIAFNRERAIVRIDSALRPAKCSRQCISLSADCQTTVNTMFLYCFCCFIYTSHQCWRVLLHCPIGKYHLTSRFVSLPCIN